MKNNFQKHTFSYVLVQLVDPEDSISIWEIQREILNLCSGLHSILEELELTGIGPSWSTPRGFSIFTQTQLQESTGVTRMESRL